MRTIITFGTFDLFHLGHLRILERARALGDRLIVGVSSDALNYRKKQVYPVYTQEARCAIVAGMRAVDSVFLEESLELKKDYIVAHGADVLVMGDDWAGRFDWCQDVCNVIYLPRTPDVSTTEVKEDVIRQAASPITKVAA